MYLIESTRINAKLAKFAVQKPTMKTWCEQVESIAVILTKTNLKLLVPVLTSAPSAGAWLAKWTPIHWSWVREVAVVRVVCRVCGSPHDALVRGLPDRLSAS